MTSTDCAPASEDSSSSSCSAAGPLGGHQQQQVSPTTLSSQRRQSFTNNNNNKLSPQQVNNNNKSPSNSVISSSSTPSNTSSLGGGGGGPKRPRFLQKLDIAPRDLQSVSQVSAVKLTSSLNKTANTSGFNSSSISPSSALSVHSSTCNSCTKSQHQQQQQQKKNVEQQQQTSSQQQTMDNNNPLLLTSTTTTSSSDDQPHQRAWSDSTIGSSASNHVKEEQDGSSSALSSPQACSQTAQFSVSSNQQQEDQQEKGSGDQQQQNQEDTPPPSSEEQQQQQQQYVTTNKSLQFTASLVHPNIYLGGAMDALHASELLARGILYVLNVAYECDFSDSVSSCDRIQKKKIDLRDSVQENIERAFEEAFAFIDEAVNKGVKILVHCFVGSSRSATIVIGYLMKKLQLQEQQQHQIDSTKQSVISQHQEKELTRTIVSSPTFTIESLTKNQSQQQQQQQQRFGFAPTTAPTTTTAALDDDDPFASASEFINDFDITSTQSSGAYQQSQEQQQHEQHQTSYYQSALEQVQKARPEVLPNLAFSFALQRMDHKLLLRASA